jgi:hypothetical protein
MDALKWRVDRFAKRTEAEASMQFHASGFFGLRSETSSTGIRPISRGDCMTAEKPM